MECATCKSNAELLLMMKDEQTRVSDKLTEYMAMLKAAENALEMYRGSLRRAYYFHEELRRRFGDEAIDECVEAAVETEKTRAFSDLMKGPA